MFTLAKAFTAVLAAASLAHATITIAQPSLKGNTTNTISWTSSDADKDPEVFTIELINQAFNSQFAIGNNIATSQGSFTFEMPVVAPGSGYSIEFVDPGNINNIFATSGAFSVQENDVSSTTGASETTGVSTTSGAASRTSTATGLSTVTQSSPRPTATTPVPTVSPSNGPITVSNTASSGSSASSGTSSSSAPAPTNTGAAMGLVPSGSFAALVAGAVALLF